MPFIVTGLLVVLLKCRETTGAGGPAASVYHCSWDVCELQSKRSLRVLALGFSFLSLGQELLISTAVTFCLMPCESETCC